MARPYFVNAPRRKRIRRRLPKRGTDGRFMKSVRGPGGRRVSRAAWRRSGYRRNPMARRLPPRNRLGRFMKRRRNPIATLNPRRRRPRHYRRNPALFGRGIVNDAIQGLVGGAGVTAGKIAVRQGISMIRLNPNTWVGVAAQGAIGVVARNMLKRFLRGGLGGSFADGLAYGAFNSAFESALRLVAPEQAEKLLGEDYVLPGLAAYYQAPALPATVGAYEQHPALQAAWA